MPVGTKFTATIDILDFYAATYMYRDAGLLNNVAIMLWSAYHCVAFLICVFVSQLHSLSNPYIS